MNNTALLIIDTQVGLIEPAYQGKEILDNISILLAQAHITCLDQVVDGFASDTHSITVKPIHEVTLS